MNLRNLTDYYTLFLLFSKKEFYSLSVTPPGSSTFTEKAQKAPGKEPAKALRREYGPGSIQQIKTMDRCPESTLTQIHTYQYRGSSSASMIKQIHTA